MLSVAPCQVGPVIHPAYSLLSGPQLHCSLGLVNTTGLDSDDKIEAAAHAVAEVFSRAWQRHAKEVVITNHSKSWWDDKCNATIKCYRESQNPADYTIFRWATQAAKRKFFDEKIEEIASEHQCPWDLMAWVKQRNLPACEAIAYNSEPCHDLDSLWGALHGTYNAASGRQCDLAILDQLDPSPERDWLPFSRKEMMDALLVCSSRSVPSPDHITWSHLKRTLPIEDVMEKFLVIANACMKVGYWPSHFKESVSVIIPKPGKPMYLTLKSFRPIALLNTLGKLIEKMISTRLQFGCVKHEVFHLNQLSGIQQRSTEGAGVFLTHLVCAGWAKGLKTSVIAFDIAQFFPSLNHKMLLGILAKQGFPANVCWFFASYLVGRGMRYLWNSFSSDLRLTDVGVGQGSALSPVLCNVLSYVNDSTLIVQRKTLEDNLPPLRDAYRIMFNLFDAFGLVMEHDKSKLFHFTCQHDDANPPIVLNFEPFTAASPLKPKTFWRYLGFYFDQTLSFQEHVQYYSTKAISTVHMMGMLGNLLR
ncbi:hypothetical protein NP233_g8682 [Leucocoprinus birnbaumii]|uniref:Reverse transcriptase domain-containing protein n=1 Tax=Leucocoprinus birnbaumii TaxID=56174 RepID=A0AAD5YTI2_9AGAR|nr:hypothetical protein NP233_g8682 [Leucocoprinus birnbaumii]